MRNLLLSAATLIGLAGGSAAAASGCPDYNQYGATYRATGDELYRSQSFSVTAGGENYIGNCRHIRPGTDRGDGYFTTAPDFTFDLRRMRGYRLEVSVVSECDASLLINTASANWYYDDDDNGNLDPRIILTRPADGWLDVWVGTYDGEFCDATLTLEAY